MCLIDICVFSISGKDEQRTNRQQNNKSL